MATNQDKYPTLTVADLMVAISSLPSDMPIRVWLPGSTISLNLTAQPMQIPNASRLTFYLEGNLDPGSALGID